MVKECKEVRADQDGIVEAADWAEECAASFGLDSEGVFMVRLCVEEAVTNVVNYAFDGAAAERWIALEARSQDDEAFFSVSDDGKPFDPVSATEPGIEGNIQDASIGGRGIRLIRKFSKSLHYARYDGLNRLTLGFQRTKQISRRA